MTTTHEPNMQRRLPIITENFTVTVTNELNNDDDDDDDVVWSYGKKSPLYVMATTPVESLIFSPSDRGQCWPCVCTVGGNLSVLCSCVGGWGRGGGGGSESG